MTDKKTNPDDNLFTDEELDSFDSATRRALLRKIAALGTAAPASMILLDVKKARADTGSGTADDIFF